jgi:hypothetical protein
MPKGVLWRQADFLVAALGVRAPDGSEIAHLDQLVEAARGRHLAALPAPPFMHGAAHWNALSCWIGGGTVVIQDHTDHFDPDRRVGHLRAPPGHLPADRGRRVRPAVGRRARPPSTRPRRRSATSSPEGRSCRPRCRPSCCASCPNSASSTCSGRRSPVARRWPPRSAGPEVGAGRFVPRPPPQCSSADLSRRAEPAMTRPSGGSARAAVSPAATWAIRTRRRPPFPASTGALGRGRRPGRAAGPTGASSCTVGSRSPSTPAARRSSPRRSSRHSRTIRPSSTCWWWGDRASSWGQEVTAVVAVRPGRSVTLEELREVGGRHLARYKLPRRRWSPSMRMQRSPSRASPTTPGPARRGGRRRTLPVSVEAATVEGTRVRRAPSPWPLSASTWCARPSRSVTGPHDPSCRVVDGVVWRAWRSEPAGPGHDPPRSPTPTGSRPPPGARAPTPRSTPHRT